MPNLTGLGQFFSAIANGGDTRNRAEAAGLYQGARADLALSKAREARNRELARGSIVGAFEANGVKPQEAELLGALFAAGYNPEQYGGYMKDQQAVNFGNQNYAAAKNPDVALPELNRMIAAASGKQYLPYTEGGNAIYRQDVSPTTEPPVSTELGHAMAQHYTTPGGGKFNYTMPDLKPFEHQEGTNPFSPLVVDQDKLNAFAAWRYQNLARDPRLADGDFAESAWLAAGMPGYTPTAAAQPGNAPAPYKEGQYLRGPDGKVYQVRNGQPVPIQ